MPISYNGFCALGGLTNKKLSTKAIYHGKYFMYIKYYLIQ